MENQPIVENQPVLQMPEAKKSHTLLAVIISVIVTAAIVGGGAYFWQNMESEEAEVATPEVVPIQTTTVKPTVTSPQNGATVENALDGVKIAGKAAPNSFVWLFQVSEMDPSCLDMGSDLAGANRVDANGNFEIIYTPYGEEENWPREFAVVSIDPNQKYKLSWLNNTFCAPEETKSDYFQLTLKQAPTNVLFQDDTYRFRVTATSKTCVDYYDFKVGEPAENAIKGYDLFVPGSKSDWPADLSVKGYDVYAQKTYDKFVPEQMPAWPRVVLQIDNGYVLVGWDPQDSPPDMPQGCRLNFEKF